MGKIRKPKPHKSKVNVIPDDSILDEEIPVDSKETAIQTIIDQLQAANVEEKFCGLQTFAFLVENNENIQQLIEKGLIKLVAPLLIDAASSVRNAAAGALRNLSAVSSETCDSLMDQDVMTSLTFYFNQYTENWLPDPTSKANSEEIDTFVQCVNLLLNLCESSELAIKYLGQSSILDILTKFLDLQAFGDTIIITVLQCLFVVIEDNPQAMQKIKTNAENQLQRLLSLEGTEPPIHLIKTLSSGVIINTCGGNLASLPATVIHQIISILSSVLSVDHRLICNQVSSSIPLANTSGKTVTPKGKEAQVLESQLKSVLQVLDAQQSAIEIVANFCSCDDGDDNDGDDSSDSDDVEEEEDNCFDTTLAEDKLPPEILEALVSLEIFDKIWARTQLPAENVMLILKEYDQSQYIAKKLLTLQSRALLCINNMISSLPIENLGNVSGVYKIWVDVGKLVFKQNSDMFLLESATAVMRAALDKIKFRENGNTSGTNLFNDLALSDIEIMLNGIKDCEVPEIRSNLIRMIGILALLLVNNLNGTTSNVICSITEFILDQAHKENEVWVLAEAIDTIVDLYSEDETDILAAKVKLVEKLADLAPILKNKARQQKRLPKEYKSLVSTASSNLPRFIKYKKARVSKLRST